MSEHRHRSSRQPPARLEGRPDVGHRPVALGPQGAILGLQRSSGAAVRDLLARSAVRDTASPDTADRQVQRFGGKEHRNIGDWATNRKYVTLGSRGYQLSYGEMIALAGDLFPSLQYMEKLADRRGTRPGYPGGAGLRAVHQDRPAAKKPWERPHSAGASYRENHEEALRRACAAGKRGESAMPALAAGSFGGHFLTDAISAGHVRTPRPDIIAHWDRLDTGLVTRFKGFMMMQVSEWILDNRQRCNLLAPASSTPVWPMASTRRWPAGPRSPSASCAPQHLRLRPDTHLQPAHLPAVGVSLPTH